MRQGAANVGRGRRRVIVLGLAVGLLSPAILALTMGRASAAEPVCAAGGPTVNCTLGGFEIDGNTVSDGGTDWQSPAVYGSVAYTPFYDLFNSTSDDIMGQGSKESDQTSWVCVLSKPPGKADLGGPSYTATAPSSDPGGDPGTAAGEFAPKGGKSWAGSIWFTTVSSKQFLYSNFQRFAVNGDVHLDIEFNKASTVLDGGSGCPTLPVRSQGDILLTYDTNNGGAQIFVSAFVFNCTTVVSKGTPCPGMLGSFAVDNGGSLVNGGTFAGTANISPAHTDVGVTAGAYGESGLNLTDTIGNFTCGEFGKTYMRTRSSGTSDIANGKAEVKDFTQPVPFNPGLCPVSTLTKAQADETTQLSGGADGTEGSGADATADAALTFNKNCNTPPPSPPAGTACASGASTTPMSANPGDELVYKLTYQNTGGGVAPNPVVTDAVPAGTAYVALTQSCPTGATCIDPNGNTVNSGAVTCTGVAGSLVWCLPPEAANSSQDLFFEVTVNTTSSSSGTVTIFNFGSVTDTQASTDTGSNSNYVAANVTYAPASHLAKGQADVQPLNQFCNTASSGGAVTSNAACASLPGSLNSNPTFTSDTPNYMTTYAIGTTSATPGDTLQYQMTYVNAGNSPATNVVVADTIGSNETYVANSATGSNSPTIACFNSSSVAVSCVTQSTTVASITWTYSSVGAGVSRTVGFQVTLASHFANGSGNTVSDVGSVTSTQEQTAINSNTVNATVTATAALALLKSASVSGSQITYTIKVYNTGNGDLTNQTVSDTIPTGTSLVAGSCSPACSGTTTLTWTGLTINAGTTPSSPGATLQFSVKSP